MDDLNKSINEKFIGAIKAKLPDGANVAKSIMDILFLGKEAVYRRLRGDVPFTFAEMATLSQKLGIPIDNIANTVPVDKILFELKPVSYSSDMRDIDYKMVNQFLDVLKFMREDPNSEMVYSSNMFYQLSFSRYYNLSKLQTLKYLYLQEYANKHNDPFHLIDPPQKLHQLHTDTWHEIKHIKNTSYIFDSTVFLSVINDIKYFRNINLITRDEDMRQFKNELHSFLNDLEEVAAIGQYKETKNKVNIYIANTNIDATYSYIVGKTYHISMIGVFSMNNICSLEESAIDRLKKWVYTQKKVSTLISESGEMHRTRFFSTQRQLIDTL